MMGDESQLGKFFKSASRFCLATALFGVKQLREVLSPDAVRAFHSVTRATEEQLDQFWLRAFGAGNQFGFGLIEVASDILTLDAFTFRGMTRILVNTMQYSAGALTVMAPTTESRATLQEFQNKLLVFNLFENVDTIFELSPEAALSELIARTADIDSFAAVWATEGIGHYYTEHVWESRGTPRGLLTDVEVPANSLVALHAGMGLSLANQILASVGQTPSDLHRALRQFVTLCRDNSAEAYLEASYEALGLVARNLYPHLVAAIDRDLAEIGGYLTDYFWHGVGRAIYFAPTNYVPLPGFAPRVVEMTQHEPPHELGRHNALAGAIWAMLLVNLREPKVIENFLLQCNRIKFDEDAFANGVNSAVIVWHDSTGDTAHLDALCRHQPCAAIAERWNTLIQFPCRRALAESFSTPKRNKMIGEVFRYRSASPQATEAVCENRSISGTQQIDRMISWMVHTLSR